jgi:hypothetical protein
MGHRYASTIEYDPEWSTSVSDPSQVRFVSRPRLLWQSLNEVFARQHADDHVGLYYTLPEDVSSLFPEGVAGEISAEWDVTGARRVQVRVSFLPRTPSIADQMHTFVHQIRKPAVQIIKGLAAIAGEDDSAVRQPEFTLLTGTTLPRCPMRASMCASNMGILVSSRA